MAELIVTTPGRTRLRRLRRFSSLDVEKAIPPYSLRWHGDEQAYVDAKRNLLRFQRPDDYAVLNEEDDVAPSGAHRPRSPPSGRQRERRRARATSPSRPPSRCPRP